jgi:hypothetical protein
MTSRLSCTRFEIYGICATCGQRLEEVSKNPEWVKHPEQNVASQCPHAGKTFKNPVLVEVEEVK